MEQNNFEKNIQQKLDELKIPPSDSVWTNVEKRITKKKREKRTVFILFFLLIFITLGGYWLWDSAKNNPQQIRQISSAIKKDGYSSTTQKRDSPSFLSTKSAGAIVVDHDSAYITVKKTKENPTNFKDNKAKKKIRIKGKSKSYTTDRVNNEKGKVTDIRKENRWKERKDELGHQQNIPKIQTGIANAKIENGNIDSNVIAQNKISTDTILKKNKEEEAVAQLDSATKKIIKEQKKYKWALGVTFSAGASMLGKNPFGINNQNSPSYFDYSNGASSNPNSGSGIPSNAGSGNPLPSALRNSAAFIGGVFVEKNIFRRNKISIGLSYRYFSLMSKVGNSIDSIVPSSSMYLNQSERFYGSANAVNTYRNHFHYLEIPVSLKFQLNKSETLPLYWQVGINVSQLISSNALQFKYNPSLYYSDNSSFHKTQVGLQTGLSFTLFAKQKNPFTIGPYFLYNVSSAADKGLYGKKHFSFIGIHTEILFKRK